VNSPFLRHITSFFSNLSESYRKKYEHSGTSASTILTAPGTVLSRLAILFTVGGLSACNSSYQVVLNDNVLYTPYQTNTTPSLLSDANLQGCLNQLYNSSGNNDPGQVTILACSSAEWRVLPE